MGDGFPWFGIDPATGRPVIQLPSWGELVAMAQQGLGNLMNQMMSVSPWAGILIALGCLTMLHPRRAVKVLAGCSLSFAVLTLATAWWPLLVVSAGFLIAAKVVGRPAPTPRRRQ